MLQRFCCDFELDSSDHNCLTVLSDHKIHDYYTNFFKFLESRTMFSR